MKKMLRIVTATAVVALVAQALAQDTFGGAAPPAQPQQQQQQPTYPPAQGQYPQGPAGGQQPAPGSWGQAPAAQPQQSPPAQAPAAGGWGQQPQQPGAGDLDQLMQMERQDFGVAPTKELHAGQMHGPTPASIPGAQVITTKGLLGLVQQKSTPYFLFDVLGGPEVLPNAMPAVWLAQPGDFRDQTQQQMTQMFAQGTGGRKDIPLVFYCLSTQCWMSYNAALRAVNAGYTNVLWYRGGIEAWKAAGLPTQPAQGIGPAGQPGYQQQPQGYPQQGYPQGGAQQPAQPQNQQQGGWPEQ
jgi:PQQ-dependent catabolism-associated CXXCW motif protein